MYMHNTLGYWDTGMTGMLDKIPDKVPEWIKWLKAMLTDRHG